MAENTRNPQQQPNDPSRSAPGQQNRQAEPGHNPGGQADKADQANRPDQASKADKPAPG